MKKLLGIFLLSLSVFAVADSSSVRVFMDGKGSDLCTGFAVTGTLQPETVKTEAELTCKDNQLQIRIRSFHPVDRPYAMPSGQISFFSNDHVEFFIQPDRTRTDYYHFATSVQGKKYAAKCKNTGWRNSSSWKTRLEKDYWEAILDIPLQEIHLSPQNGKMFYFNICRARIDGKDLINSTFALLPGSTFHDPENWKAAQFIPSGEPVRIVSRKYQPNLIKNPNFAFTDRNRVSDWTLGRDAKRIETMALSNDWIIQGSGKAYAMLFQDVILKKSVPHTMQIKARRFGNDGRMGVAMMVRKPDGNYREVLPYIVWNYPLTDSFREYRFVFTPPENNVKFIFYRLGDHRNDSNGVEYSSIKLYEGRQSPIEIRPFNFFKIGLKKKVPGTGPVFQPNLYGRHPRKLRVLNIFSKFFFGVHLLEQQHGLNIETNNLTLYGESDWTPDIYYTDDSPDSIMKKITDNQYDVYYIANDFYCAEKVGRELYAMLLKNIQKGAVLWINSAAPLSLPGFNKKITQDTLTPVGKGKILRTIPRTPPHFGWFEDSGARAEYFAWKASRLYHLAGSPRLFNNLKFEKNNLSFDAPAGISYEWKLYNPAGELTSQGSGQTRGSHTSIPCPPEKFSGSHSIHLHAFNDHHQTLDFALARQQISAPSIQSIATDKSAYSGNEKARVSVQISDARENMQIRWYLKDWTGRILEQSRQPAGSSCKLAIPIENLQTNLGRLQVSLYLNQKECDRKEQFIIARDRDRKRHVQEFTISNWDSVIDPRFYSAQLESIGIDNCIRPYDRPMAHMLHGLSVAGDPRDTSSIFHPVHPPVKNIRQPSLSAPETWKKLLRRVSRLNQKEWKYGLTSVGIGDEIGLMNRNWKLDEGELDSHPLNLKAYRQSMQKKYGSIAAFNRTCGTSYSDFSQLQPIVTSQARKKQNFAEFIEWRNFNADQWVKSIARIGAMVKESDPEYPFCLYNSFGPRACIGNDYWKLLTQGKIDCSFEYTSMVYPGMRNPLYDFDEIYRSLRPDMPVWGFIGYYWNKKLAGFQPWWFALHRYRGFTWFGMTSIGGGGTLVTIPNYELTQESELLRTSIAQSRLLAGMGRLFADYKWADRDVAVLWSNPSMMVSWCLGNERTYDELRPGSSFHDWQYSRYSIRYMLEYLLYQYDYVVPEQLASTLSGRRVLILPHAIALSDSDIAEIKKFIRRGGTIIADVFPGDYTELGVRRSVNPLAALGSDRHFIVLGQRFNDVLYPQRAKLLTLLQTASARPVLRSSSVPRLSGREAMHFKSGDMNVYAVLRNPDLSEDNEKQVFSFSGGHVYDLREKRYLGKTNTLTKAVPPGGVAVFGVYPYRVLSLDVKSPSVLSCGDSLIADIAINSSTGRCGHHVFHAELTTPDGKTRRRIHTRNLSAPQGKAQLKIKMAYNDSPGKWNLKITDIMTGISTDKKFVLK